MFPKSMKLLGSLTALTLAFAGCNGALPEEEALVGEATSYLTSSEETGDLGGDAVALEAGGDLDATVDAASTPPTMPPDASGVCDFSARRAQVKAHYDTNNDGVLDAAERRALRADLESRVGHPLAVRFGLRHRAHVMRRVRWAFDENHDGQLSPDERTALVDAMEARCQLIRARVLARFDVDGDGRLSETEKQAAKDALRARIEARHQELLTRFDANQNGRLDPDEIAALRAAVIAEFQSRRAAIVARFDTDGDGALNAREIAALKAAIRQRVAEGRDAGDE